MRPILHDLIPTIVPVIVVAGLMGLAFHSLVHAQNFRPIAHAGKPYISAIAKPATVSEAWGMDRTRRLSRWHRPISTASRPS